VKYTNLYIIFLQNIRLFKFLLFDMILLKDLTLSIVCEKLKLFRYFLAYNNGRNLNHLSEKYHLQQVDYLITDK